MRSALRLLGTRYGMALVMVVLVLGVVAAFRGVNGSRKAADSMAPALETASGPHPTTSGGVGDDGVVDAAGPNASGDLPSKEAAEATNTASRFTAAWLHHQGVTAEQWRATLTPYATTTLLASFAQTDPSAVPANSTTGQVNLAVRNPTLVEASVPLDAGTLRLTLVATAGRWQVDQVDWDRPR